MSFFKRLLKIYKDSVLQASKVCLSQAALIPIVIAGYCAFAFLFSFVSSMSLGIAGGFLLGLLQLSFITYIYKWVILAKEHRLPSLAKLGAVSDDDPWAHVKRKQRGMWYQEAIGFDTELFLLIINAAFPIFIVEFAVSFSTNTAISLPVFLKLGIVFLFNPLPEVILINRTNGLSAISEALLFIKSHLLEWFAPILLFFSPLLLLVGSTSTWLQSVILLMASSEVLIPGELIGRPLAEVIGTMLPIGPIPGFIIGTVVGVWISLFRLELFERLQSLPEIR